MKITIELQKKWKATGSVSVNGSTFCNIKYDIASSAQKFDMEDNFGNKAQFICARAAFMGKYKAQLLLNGNVASNIEYRQSIINTTRVNSMQFAALSPEFDLLAVGDIRQGTYELRKDDNKRKVGHMTLNQQVGERLTLVSLFKERPKSYIMSIEADLNPSDVLPLTALVLMIFVHIQDYGEDYSPIDDD